MNIDVNELALRILSELEEARADNVTALCNTVIAPAGLSHELDRMGAACIALVEAGDAICREFLWPDNETRRILATQAAVAMLATLGDAMTFDESAQIWRSRSKQTMEIVLTKQGYASAVAVLEERGYRWWHQNQK